jgi:hypothetical protein
MIVPGIALAKKILQGSKEANGERIAGCGRGIYDGCFT